MSKVVVILVVITTRVTLTLVRTFNKITFYIKVFPIPPGLLRKKTLSP